MVANEIEAFARLEGRAPDHIFRWTVVRNHVEVCCYQAASAPTDIPGDRQRFQKNFR